MSNTPLHHFCNREFVKQLCDLQDRNVLLLMVDGSAVFGRIARIDDCVLSVVPPVGVTALNFVQFRPPNGTLPLPLILSQIFIDVCDIAHAIEGPFVFSPLFPLHLPGGIGPNGVDAAGTQIPPAVQSIIEQITTGTGAQGFRSEPSAALPGRQQHELLEELCDLEGQNIAITTLGGWTIGGQLGEVDDCVSLISTGTSIFPPIVFLGVVLVFGPAFPLGFIVLLGTFRVWSNLKTLTQVILP
ncbi:MAG: hypothetical protein GX348_11435 [Veillonellaceae bacterium]|jgi:small nuclear ribonucleoprotein (snRNP)-like protein|nr:hypothetical protein [Veillonellaceae bacterium]